MPTEGQKREELSIRDLYPDFTEEQLQEAEKNLERFAEVIWRICERLELDEEE